MNNIRSLTMTQNLKFPRKTITSSLPRKTLNHPTDKSLKGNPPIFATHHHQKYHNRITTSDPNNTRKKNPNPPVPFQLCKLAHIQSVTGVGTPNKSVDNFSRRKLCGCDGPVSGAECTSCTGRRR